MTTRTPVQSDLAIPPGEYLAEVLAEKGLTQSELARRIGRPIQPINEIVRGRKAVTAETALELESALGVSAHVWMGLEVEYRLTLARNAAKTAKRSGRFNPAGRTARKVRRQA